MRHGETRKAASSEPSKSSPLYAKFREPLLRSLSPGDRLAAALHRTGPLKQLALANTDVRRIVKLIEEGHARLPRQRTPWEWAMLQAADSSSAVAASEHVKTDRAGQLDRFITLRLEPTNASAAMGVYWTHLASGEKNQGLQVLRQCAELGVPLPEMK